MTEECYQKRKKEEELSLLRLKTGIVIIILSGIWMVLELIIYGEIQSRLVDDIMMVIFIPFIYKALKYSNYKKQEKE